jgi:maleate cis-trans isomerase
MTALGFLYPGHSAEDDYPRIEQLLGSDIRLDVVHTDIGTDAHRVDALLEMGSAERLAAGVEELRMSGAESVVWACTSGSFVHGWDGAQEQVRTLKARVGARIADLRKQKRAIEQTLEELISIERQARAWLQGTPVVPVEDGEGADD